MPQTVSMGDYLEHKESHMPALQETPQEKER